MKFMAGLYSGNVYIFEKTFILSIHLSTLKLGNIGKKYFSS